MVASKRQKVVSIQPYTAKSQNHITWHNQSSSSISECYIISEQDLGTSKLTLTVRQHLHITQNIINFRFSDQVVKEMKKFRPTKRKGKWRKLEKEGRTYSMKLSYSMAFMWPPVLSNFDTSKSKTTGDTVNPRLPNASLNSVESIFPLLSLSNFSNIP